jgi:hypothetical protein
MSSSIGAPDLSRMQTNHYREYLDEAMLNPVDGSKMTSLAAG